MSISSVRSTELFHTAWPSHCLQHHWSSSDCWPGQAWVGGWEVTASQISLKIHLLLQHSLFHNDSISKVFPSFRNLVHRVPAYQPSSIIVFVILSLLVCLQSTLHRLSSLTSARRLVVWTGSHTTSQRIEKLMRICSSNRSDKILVILSFFEIWGLRC